MSRVCCTILATKGIQIRPSCLERPRPSQSQDGRDGWFRNVGQWKALTLAQDHPAYPAWQNLVRIDQAESANSVQALIQDLVSEELFVSSILVQQKDESGPLETTTVWTEGVPSLLAEADKIAFAHPDAPKNQLWLIGILRCANLTR